MPATWSVRLVPSRRRVKVAGVWLPGTPFAPPAPESGFTAPVCESRAPQPEERPPQEPPADAARDLVIDGGLRGLPGHLPAKAAQEGIGGQFPKAAAGRSRESLIDGSPVGGLDLV